MNDTASATPPHLRYQRLVTRAEAAIYAQRLEAADSLYEASTGACTPFLADLHNATVVALYLGDVPKAGRLIAQLVDQGVDVNWIDRNKELYYPELVPEWPSLKATLDERERAHKRTLDYDLVIAINAIENEDQRVRDLGADDSVLLATDSTNVRALIALFEKHGFPAQRQLDLNNPFDQRYGYYLPFLHELKNANAIGDRLNIIPIIDQALYGCKITANLYASFMAHIDTKIGGMGNYGETVVLSLVEPGDTLYRVKLPDREINLINRNRARLGLSSYRERVSHLRDYFTGAVKIGRFDLPASRSMHMYPSELKSELPLDPIGIYLPIN